MIHDHDFIFDKSAIRVDPSIEANPNDPILKEKLRKANEFVQALPSLTARILRERAKQYV